MICVAHWRNGTDSVRDQGCKLTEFFWGGKELEISTHKGQLSFCMKA